MLNAVQGDVWKQVEKLAAEILLARERGKCLFLCGNGGSGGNAIHLANDFLYLGGKGGHVGLNVEALTANSSILTCLGNDIGYEEIFAYQLMVEDDVLIVLSGSGNSENVVRALEVGNKRGLTTSAILGYSGGRCLNLAKIPVHFDIDDMQISEDLQLMVGHICMQWLKKEIQ